MLAWNPNKIFLVVDGIIGAGKTELIRALAQKTGWASYFEPVKENPYLENFYKVISGKKPNEGEPIMMQIFLLNRRFADHRKIIANGGNSLQDRTIWGDNIFARNLYKAGFISELDYQTYLNLFDNMQRDLVAPTMVLYLDVSPEVARQRIAQRDRSVEHDIDLEYLRNLAQAYDDWLRYMEQSTMVHRLPYDNTALNDENLATIISLIEAKHKKRRQGHFLAEHRHLITN